MAREICETVDNHSSYVQQLAYIVWIGTRQRVDRQIFETAVKDLIAQNANLFYNITQNLTRYQLNFLRAMLDGLTSGFTTSTVLKKYDLGSSANVVRLKKSLEQKEIVDITGKNVTFSDPVFRLWLAREMKHV